MMKQVIKIFVIIAVLTGCNPSKPIPTFTPSPLTGGDIITAGTASTLVKAADFSEGEMGPVTALAFTPDSTRLKAVHAGTPVLRHWNISSQSLSFDYELEAVGLGAVAFDGDAGQLVLAGAADAQALSDEFMTGKSPEQILGPQERIEFIDAESGQLLHFISAYGKGGDFYGVSLNGDGHIVATQSGKGAILVFRRAANASEADELLLSVDHHQSQLGVDFALDRNGELLAEYAGNGFIRLWNVQNGQKWGELNIGQGHSDRELEIGLITISPARQWLAVFAVETANPSASGYVSLGRLGDQAIQWQTEIEAPYIHAFAFSLAGNLLAGGSSAGVHIWNVATGEEVKRFGGESVFAVAFSPDGSQLAWGDKTGGIHLARLSAGE